MAEPVAEAVERRLREAFDPVHLEIEDDSDLHRGHPGATSGGGHFRVVIVSDRFERIPLLEQHRLVYEALGGLVGGEVHALGLRTVPPSRWTSD